MGAVAILAIAIASCTSNPDPKADRGTTQTSASNPASYVDPFIGTGGHGHTYPGATVPFGMVQLSPDTRLTGWDSCSGYHYSDDKIHGFSHTHLSGTGVPDYCDVLLVPTLQALEEDVERHPQSFQKASEVASPGYYRVVLGGAGVDEQIQVELTATRRVGMHRYRFPASRHGHVVLDLEHRDKVTKSSVAVDPRSCREVYGHRWSQAWARDQRVFFVMQFSRPFDASDANNIGVELSFEPSAEPLLIKVGISATGIEAARRNLEAELPHWDFDRVKREARGSWNHALCKVQVEGGTKKQKRIFYTALYHCFLAPNLFSDVDGSYRGLDGKVHEGRGHDVYTVFSLWDTFRAAHPLYTILERERTKDFLGTFLAHYEDGGRLPVWEL